MFIIPTAFINNSEIEADICIIGGGAAGITIALEYFNTNKKVVLLAGGDWKESLHNRELNKGFVNAGSNHEPLEENRRRQFGGATSVWGGRCIPFDSIDFEKRDWLPNCEWPLKEDELIPFYQPALDVCDAGKVYDFDARSVFSNKQKEIIKGLDNDEIYSWPLERWSPPVKFGEKFKEALSQSTNIVVYLDAHVLGINLLNGDKEKIDNVDIKINSLDGKVKAKIFILATGGIENPRLLLASKSAAFPNGIGNQNDNVGRYYMSHFLGTFAVVKPFDRKNFVFDFEKDENGVYCRRRWWISPDAQKQHKIGNAIFFLHRSTRGEGHRDSVFSSIYLTKVALKILREKKVGLMKKKWDESRSEITEHLKIVIKDSPSLAPKLFNLAKMRLAKRRLPFILPSINANQFFLYFQTEHLPNRNSRILLSDKKDRFGIPFPLVDIKFQEVDIETVVDSHKIFVERFKKENLGEIMFDETELRKFLKVKIENFNSSAHQLGTTRMSDNPKLGVVDKNCKVYGTSNLYVSGSSVFPTGGHANPTLLVVTLALRLAKHLKNIYP